MSSSNSENSRSRAEVEHLSRLEAIVRGGLDADIEVGNALAEINDTWLYRATHQTFEAYLRDRWGMSASRGDELIEAAEAARPSSADIDGPAQPLPSHAHSPAPARPDPTDGLATVWEQARREFDGDDVIAVDIHLTVHKREQLPQLKPNPWPSSQGSDMLESGDLLPRLRWLMTESSGTIAYIAHKVETRASELDDDARDRLRDDVLVLDEDLATLKALLLAPVDWDTAHGRLIAGEIPPFEDDFDEDDEDD
jgi:hypothetical protein